MQETDDPAPRPSFSPIYELGIQPITQSIIESIIAYNRLDPLGGS